MRLMKKRLKDMPFNEDNYIKQMAQLGEAFYDPTKELVSLAFKPVEAAKDKLAADVLARREKAQKFSRRRRQFINEETVEYINESNRAFNKKLEKSYGTQYDFS